MATYAIGDIQGCFGEFMQLLEEINFKNGEDILWFTGDLVNRGPQSLSTLRYVKNLGDQHITVLGNHDLHLLALYYAVNSPVKNNDSLKQVLDAPDCDDLMQWLRNRPLFHYDNQSNCALSHAGMPPFWTIQQTERLAKEVEAVLKSDKPKMFLDKMYGNTPDLWDEHLEGIDRLRCITNYLTRMRFCYPDGRLNLSYKGTIEGKPELLLPWFSLPNRINRHVDILFGHWAALGGKATDENVYPLDTGCVWGNCLTALRVEDKRHFSVKCHDKAINGQEAE